MWAGDTSVGVALSMGGGTCHGGDISLGLLTLVLTWLVASREKVASMEGKSKGLVKPEPCMVCSNSYFFAPFSKAAK